MGCSNSSTTVVENENGRLHSREGIENQLRDLKDGTDIKIYSAMLVNENKGDVLKYYKPIQTIGKGRFLK